VLIYGHRGSPATNAENTLPSFEEAIRAGVHGLEFDVRESANGIPMILHDRGLDRTTNGHGHIDEMSFEMIRNAVAGNGAQIPTLDEVLDLAGGLVHLDIEVKQAGIEKTILESLARFPKARYILSSFDPDILLAFRSLSSTVDLAPISTFASREVVEFAQQLGSRFIALMADAYNEQSASWFEDADLKVIVWTVNDMEEALRVKCLGAYGLCTDRPAEIIEALRGRTGE
jgi:glycerophosphoryl diester phosphodiesterase